MANSIAEWPKEAGYYWVSIKSMIFKDKPIRDIAYYDPNAKFIYCTREGVLKPDSSMLLGIETKKIEE